MGKYAILLAFLAGCGKVVDCSTVWTVQNKSKYIQDQTILDGGAWWKDVGVTFVLVDRDPKIVVKDLGPNPDVFGETFVDQGLVLLAIDSAVVAAHEFGHAMGLPHFSTNDPCRLMNPLSCTIWGITGEDAELFFKVREGCP